MPKLGEENDEQQEDANPTVPFWEREVGIGSEEDEDDEEGAGDQEPTDPPQSLDDSKVQARLDQLEKVVSQPAQPTAPPETKEPYVPGSWEKLREDASNDALKKIDERAQTEKEALERERNRIDAEIKTLKSEGIIESDEKAIEVLEAAAKMGAQNLRGVAETLESSRLSASKQSVANEDRKRALSKSKRSSGASPVNSKMTYKQIKDQSLDDIVATEKQKITTQRT